MESAKIYGLAPRVRRDQFFFLFLSFFLISCNFFTFSHKPQLAILAFYCAIIFISASFEIYFGAPQSIVMILVYTS